MCLMKGIGYLGWTVGGTLWGLTALGVAQEVKEHFEPKTDWPDAPWVGEAVSAKPPAGMPSEPESGIPK